MPELNAATQPTTDKLQPGSFSSVLDRNIGALQDRRKEDEAKSSVQAKIAEVMTHFAGSMVFVYLHLLAVCLWVAVNQGLIPVVPRFDQSYVILATVASVEALFLSTFVLISQNRAAAAADRRAELDVQINLLSEHEITRLLQLTMAVAEKLGVREASDPSLIELKEHVAPEKVLDRIEAGNGPTS